MKKLITVAIFIIIVGFIGSLWWGNGLSAVNPKDKTPQIFVIKEGERIREIGNNLKTKKLIKDPVVFFLLVKKLGLDKKIEAGDFRLNPSLTAEQIIQNLTHGTIDIWVTIKEGERAEEIADTLQKKIPSYNTVWRNALAKHEGYLFPDTYLMPKDADVNIVIDIMRKNFEKKYTVIKNSKPSNLTEEQIVILASLVEREAKLEVDRPLVASVILNRLKISMPLQIDATVQYALGYSKEEKTWWRKNLSLEDLKTKSPYNTYENTGLPSSPIANPGLESLKAVLNPADTDYLYYISDSRGRNHYARTLAEHNANIKKYGL